MTTSPIRAAVIIGSTREGRYADVIANWFLARARRRDDLTVDVLDLAEIDLPARFTRERTPALTDYLSRLGEADAFVVITPEYNHSYPASLKHAVDFANLEWHRKPLAFVSYGGVSGGLRAVEHLRQVFAERHAFGIRDTVSFHNPWPQFADDGELHDPAATEAAETAVRLMIDDLVWWATALRRAREADLVAAAAPASEDDAAA
jgi:NAD(P)H-dependent FMN reductase